MRRDWEPEELIAGWTLLDDDWRLLANRTGANRLGFALLLKYFELDARFPRHAGEVPPAAVAYVAGQVKVSMEAYATYDWSGRTIIYHRAQIRAALGFREPTRADEEQLVAWLADEVCPRESGEERLRTALLGRCRAERIEPPGRMERILAAAQTAFEQRFCQQTVARLSATCNSCRVRSFQIACWVAELAKAGALARLAAQYPSITGYTSKAH